MYCSIQRAGDGKGDEWSLLGIYGLATFVYLGHDGLSSLYLAYQRRRKRKLFLALVAGRAIRAELKEQYSPANHNAAI